MIGCLTEFFETSEEDIYSDFAFLRTLVLSQKIKIVRNQTEAFLDLTENRLFDQGEIENFSEDLIRRVYKIFPNGNKKLYLNDMKNLKPY